ncbi:hypothetical protein Rhe02_81270 [Rhizocola hellebori]|uniref:Pilus assembly protein n=1 Tax=Rhizocola hellebori TaxID=1392758 RepID=A0A8J3VKS1_9ACTN|nr:pilus assembly protein [Rhizocola hellebori]GIH10060.1 hypothetical protein Rhe02_81270 [Rhizocola hellebori]
MKRRKPFSDNGSVTTEMAVFAVPVLVALAMFVVFCGRAASAAIDVRAIAGAAARAAADAPSAALAPDAASRAAADMAASMKWACSTAADTAQFHRGGTVAVSVTCVIQLSDLGIAGLEGTKAVTATAVQPIDTWRAGQ